jgi:hypothetical protein
LRRERHVEEGFGKAVAFLRSILIREEKPQMWWG